MAKGRGRGRDWVGGRAVFFVALFLNRLGKVVEAVRVGIQRRPWRSMPKMAVHGHFPLGFWTAC